MRKTKDGDDTFDSFVVLLCDDLVEYMDSAVPLEDVLKVANASEVIWTIALRKKTDARVRAGLNIPN